MNNREQKYQQLDQYDYFEDEWLHKIEDKYAPLIGMFVIRFSELESALNIAIAEAFFDDSHDFGYLVIESLLMYPKIELFNRMYYFGASISGKPALKTKCKEIVARLKVLNKFRNEVVHGLWPTLTKDGYVRTKIETDSETGFIKFKSVKIKPKEIRDGIREVQKLILELEEFPNGIDSD